MTLRSTSIASTLLLTTTLISACSGTPGADQILSLSESTQRQAVMECQAEQGLNIPEALSVLRLNDGRVTVSMVNGSNVSLTQARAINLCARAKLINTAPALQPVATEINAPKQQYAAPIVEHTVQASSTDYRPPNCITGGGVFQGGTSICPGY